MVLRGIFGHRPASFLATSDGQPEVMRGFNPKRTVYMRVSSQGTANSRCRAVCSNNHIARKHCMQAKKKDALPDNTFSYG